MVEVDQLERDFQADVIEFARHYGWRVYSVPDSRRASEKGYPDLTFWRVDHRRGQGFFFAELKREHGVLREEQIRVHGELRELGHEVYVWRPSDWPAIVKVLGPTRKGK